LLGAHPQQLRNIQSDTSTYRFVTCLNLSRRCQIADPETSQCSKSNVLQHCNRLKSEVVMLDTCEPLHDATHTLTHSGL
jgi:hypothetical protein